MEELNTKLVELYSRKRIIENNIQELEKKKRKLLSKKHDVVFRILCTPSKSNHVTHTQGYFSTYEKAKNMIPKDGSSYDDEDNCRWRYTIVSEKSEENMMGNIDKPLQNFPYYGR